MKILSKEELRQVNINLIMSCHTNDFNRVKLSLNSGADVNVRFPIDRSKEEAGYPPYTNKTPLLTSINVGCEKIVELLLMYKADTEIRDLSNRTPLMIAAGNNLLEIAELLIKNKANVNAVNNNFHEIYEWSVLTWAIHSHSPKMVELLVSNSVSIDKRAMEFAKSESCICSDRDYSNARYIHSYLEKNFLNHFMK